MALMADYFDRMIVNTILVAIDGSPSSLQAARAAIAFAKENVSKLTVMAFKKPDCAALDRDQLQDAAYEIGMQAQQARVPFELNMVQSQHPADQIVAEALRRHCDLVWIPAPLKEEQDGPCLGTSVAVEVMERSEAPVMLFRSRAG